MPEGFSIAHIRKVLFDEYGLYLIDEHQGYKANRYRRFHTYRVVNEDNHIIMEHVTLKALANFLKQLDVY